MWGRGGLGSSVPMCAPRHIKEDGSLLGAAVIIEGSV